MSVKALIRKPCRRAERAESSKGGISKTYMRKREGKGEGRRNGRREEGGRDDHNIGRHGRWGKCQLNGPEEKNLLRIVCQKAFSSVCLCRLGGTVSTGYSLARFPRPVALWNERGLLVQTHELFCFLFPGEGKQPCE